MLGRVVPVILLAIVAMVSLPAVADVVVMDDGRRFEGVIVAEDATQVVLDTMISPTIRTKLSLKRSEIRSAERQPLPQGFFDPPPVPDRAPPPQDRPAEALLYLEVPVMGALGEDVFAHGIDKALRYARRHGVHHVVFVIDSTGQGNLDEARAVSKVLRQYDKALTFHAVIRRCTGPAMIVALWCDSWHVGAGAIIGASSSRWTPRGTDEAARTEELMLRAQLANEVVKQVDLRAPESDLVRAMIDPTISLAAWRNTEDEIVVDPRVPPETPGDRVIFEVGEGELLVLGEEQALTLGARRLDGGMSQLGEQLGLAGWEPESDYGREAMREVAAREQQRAAETSARYSKAVEQNIRRRETLEHYLEESMRLAAEWDPARGNYEYYSRRWGWGWSGGKLKLTGDSRRRWTQRSDITLDYLTKAGRAIVALERLDREAVELGLEPSFKPEDLAWMMQDVQTRFDYLRANREPGVIRTP
ncbi:MAG: hypothetical protein ACYTGC_15250 [Planctomycetota bacterium]|jgi:hypothetical protein